MDEIARLADTISLRHGVSTTVRPGVVFVYFGQGAGLEIRVGEDPDRFDCTMLCPRLPVRTVQCTTGEVLAMADDIAHGHPERAARRGSARRTEPPAAPA